MKYITLEQHQMLEDMTGLQHTRTGQVRKKQNRRSSETERLGLRLRVNSVRLRELIALARKHT